MRLNCYFVAGAGDKFSIWGLGGFPSVVLEDNTSSEDAVAISSSTKPCRCLNPGHLSSSSMLQPKSLDLMVLQPPNLHEQAETDVDLGTHPATKAQQLVVGADQAGPAADGTLICLSPSSPGLEQGQA